MPKNTFHKSITKKYKICSVCNKPCDERVCYDIKIENVYMLLDVCLGCLFVVKSDFLN